MKTNIRLFVPNTTEALDFEYGLLIHYMKYNEYRSQAEIGLKYYELADIDPINNALDIVQQQIITDTTRSQSKIDGFTLDSHYTLSFDQRFNNRIDADSVRQVWLWLHCKNSEDYPFLLERITNSEEKMLSQQNQLLVRLWAHPDWTTREIQPPAAHTVSNQTELLNTLKQRLSVHFDHIEAMNRQKALAEFDIKKMNITPIIIPEIPVAEYEPKPTIGNNLNFSENPQATAIAEQKLSLEEKMFLILKEYRISNFYIQGYIPKDKFKNACTSYPVRGFERALALFDTSASGDAKTGMLIGMKGIHLKNNWPAETPKSFVSWEELSFVGKPVQNSESFDIFLTNECNFNIFCFDGDIGMESYKIIDLLNHLILCYKQHNGLVDQTSAILSRPLVSIETDDLMLLQQAFIEWRTNSRSKKLLDYLSNRFLQKIKGLEYEIVFAKTDYDLHRMIIDHEPSEKSCMIGLAKLSQSLMYCHQKNYQTDEAWQQDSWYKVSIDLPNSLGEKTINLLELLDIRSGEISRLPISNLNSQETTATTKNISFSKSSDSEPEAPVYVATQNNIPEPIEQPKKSTWWIWPLIVFIGFLFNPVAGGVLIALAICWYILKFIFSSPILCLILVVIIIFGFLSMT